jgi:hypothetical protein
MIFTTQYSTRKTTAGKAKSTRANGKMFVRNVRRVNMKKSLILLCLILFVSNFVVANSFKAEIREQDTLISKQEELIALQNEFIDLQPDTITITEPYTLIRNSDDYIYLSSLTINRDKWENADKQTDINGVTWYEIMQDGYIKVYAEGHIVPDQVHWYAAY